MKRATAGARFAALAVGIALLQPVAAGAATAPRVGSKCSPVGRVVTVAGLRYTCTRLNGKLVWGKPRKVVPAPTPVPSPTTTQPIVPATPIATIAPVAKPVEPATVPASRYAFQGQLASGLPIHWSSCAPITWTYFDEPARPEGLGVVQTALQIVANATGFTFTYVAPGNAAKPLWSTIGDPNAPATPAKLQVLFGDARNIPSLVGDSWGNTALYWQPDTGQAQVGYVVVRPDVKYGTKDFGFRGLGLVVLHELGHAMGLDHVASTNDLMYPDLNSVSVTSFAAGDLLGLYKVSAAIPCGR